MASALGLREPDGVVGVGRVVAGVPLFFGRRYLVWCCTSSTGALVATSAWFGGHSHVTGLRIAGRRPRSARLAVAQESMAGCRANSIRHLAGSQWLCALLLCKRCQPNLVVALTLGTGRGVGAGCSDARSLWSAARSSHCIECGQILKLPRMGASIRMADRKDGPMR